MPCILSWSLSLSDWLHLFPSNLALSFGKYDKLNTDPVFCVRLLISLALSQPSPYRATASLLSSLWFHQSQHYCAWSHFHLVKQEAQGAGSSSWQLLSQPLCSLEKPCSSQCLHSVLKMRDSFYKPYRYHYNCCFFQLGTNWNLPVIASHFLWIWYHGATSSLWQSLDTNAGPLRPGDTAIIEQCLLYFLFSTVMLSWENIHWNPFCLFWNMSFSWNNSLGSYRKRISVWTTYFLKRGRETYMLNFYCLVSRSNRIHIS